MHWAEELWLELKQLTGSISGITGYLIYGQPKIVNKKLL